MKRKPDYLRPDEVPRVLEVLTVQRSHVADEKTAATATVPVFMAAGTTFFGRT